MTVQDNRCLELREAFPGGTSVLKKKKKKRKEKPTNTGDIRDTGSFPGLGRYPEGGHGNPLHYSCLENFTDRGDWQIAVHRVTKIQTLLKRLRMHTWNSMRYKPSNQRPLMVGNQISFITG